MMFAVWTCSSVVILHRYSAHVLSVTPGRDTAHAAACVPETEEKKCEVAASQNVSSGQVPNPIEKESFK